MAKARADAAKYPLANDAGREGATRCTRGRVRSPEVQDRIELKVASLMFNGLQ